MRHPRLAAWAAGVWVVAIAATLVATRGTALLWMAPIAVGCSVVLALRQIRTVAFALPVAAIASIDVDAGTDRVALALVSVIAAIGTVALLDRWRDARPDGSPALLDTADRAAWWAAQRPMLLRFGAGLVVVAAVWTVLSTGSWSPPGLAVALVPVAAVLAVALAAWPLWQPAGRE